LCKAANRECLYLSSCYHKASLNPVVGYRVKHWAELAWSSLSKPGVCAQNPPPVHFER
jgi:hypothetical protein